jgi:hypothetical protein
MPQLGRELGQCQDGSGTHLFDRWKTPAAGT